MKYYTAKEACDVFYYLIPEDEWTLRRWIKEGKFPKHDSILNGKQVWSEYTILNWKKIVKISKCPTAHTQKEA